MRAPNLGTSCVSLHACAQSRLQIPPAVLAAPTPLKHSLRHMSIPRHLAPTVGQETAAGVTFCMGSRGRFGDRVATGLITTFGSIDFVADNAACFAGSVFPEDCTVISFGEHRVYITFAPEYPARVQACSDHLLETGDWESSPGFMPTRRSW